MDTAVATLTQPTATEPNKRMSYTTFKQALITLHEEGKEGHEDGDYQVLQRGIQLLNEMSALFPGYARQLADDPEFLS